MNWFVGKVGCEGRGEVARYRVVAVTLDSLISEGALPATSSKGR